MVARFFNFRCPLSTGRTTEAATDTNLRLVENHYPAPSSNAVNSVPDAANAEHPNPSAPPLIDPPSPSLSTLSELIQVGRPICVKYGTGTTIQFLRV